MRSKKEIVIEFEYIENQITQASDQLDKFDTQHAKLRSAIDAVTKLSNNTEALVPISEGVYTCATITQTDSVIIDIGADVAVRKTREQAVHILESQLHIVESYQDKLTQRLQKLSQRADELQAELRELEPQKTA